MRIINILLIGITAVSVCFAQTVNSNISGKVTDTGTTPIAGAAVSLEKGGLTATSGTDGSFTLTGGISGTIDRNNRFLLQGPSAAIHNGVLYVNTTDKSALEITACNLQGQVIASLKKTLDAGTNLLPLRQKGLGIFLYRVKIDKSEFLIKGTSVCGVVRGNPVSLQSSPTAHALAKTAAINDVIAVKKSGYLNYREVVYNTDTSGIEIKMIPCEEPLIDVDENVYQTVRIGNQVWMAENLRVTKYNDGTVILLASDDSAWRNLTTPRYCYYNITTNTDSIKKYGALYNWYVISPTNLKKVAPVGWHVPSDADWDTLQNYLIAKGYNWDGTTDSNKIAKSLAAKTDWWTIPTIGTIGYDLTKNNSSGFSALPGGSRYDNGTFQTQGSSGTWWSATEFDTTYAFYRDLYFEAAYLWRYYRSKNCGFSVRLVRD